jgi:hypothetical protein
MVNPPKGLPSEEHVSWFIENEMNPMLEDQRYAKLLEERIGFGRRRSGPASRRRPADYEFGAAGRNKRGSAATYVMCWLA